jgi:hypothetical protein
MKRVQAWLWLIPAFLFLAACAATVPARVETATPKEKQAPVVPPVKPPEERVILPRSFPDRDLLLDGIVQLNRPGRPDQKAAREIFSALIQNHPGSRWRPAAENFIRMIDEGEASQERSRQERLVLEKAQAERAKALQENELLKKTVRDLNEKHQAEMAVLSQENERLKKDLQRLKALEIELQRRERMLR